MARDAGETNPLIDASSSSTEYSEAGFAGRRDAEAFTWDAGADHAVADGASQDGNRDSSLANDGARAFDGSGQDRAIDSPGGIEGDARDARREDAPNAVDAPVGDTVFRRLDAAVPTGTEPLKVVWRSLNTFQPDGGTQAINALVYHQGALYAGGTFSGLGSLSGNGVVRWQADEWSLVGDGKVNGEVSALAVDATGALYAGGKFEAVGATPALALAKWSANTWSALPEGPTEPVRALAVDDKNILHAAGDTFMTDGAGAFDREFYARIWRWNGQAWTNDEKLVGKCTLIATVDRCGPFERASINMMVSIPGRNVVYGGALTNFSPPYYDPNNTLSSLQAFAADKSGALYVGGQMTEYLYSRDNGEKVFSDPRDCIRKHTWNDGGTREDVLLHDDAGTLSIKAMVADNRGNLYFAGRFSLRPSAQNIAVWDGKRIRALGTGVDGTVRALALNDRGDQLFVAGTFVTAGGVLSPMVAVAELETVLPDGGP